MMPFQSDDRCMRPIVGIEFRKNAPDSPFDGVLRDGELIRNLRVRVSRSDETQHHDFCRGQCLVAHMLGDLERGLG